MTGYRGYSMSNNAVYAYEKGEKPLSKWTKTDILDKISRLEKKGDIELQCSMDLLKKLPVQELKKAVLERSSYHHTSCRYNKTDFYSVSASKCEALVNSTIEEKINSLKNSAKHIEAPKPEPVVAECKFLEWSGSKAHPMAKEITEIGEVKGNWFFRNDGTKKFVKAKGFQLIRVLSSDEIQSLKAEKERISEENYRLISVNDLIKSYSLPMEFKKSKDGKEIAIVTFSDNDKRAYPADKLDVPYFSKNDLKKIISAKEKPSAIKAIENIKSEQKAAQTSKTISPKNKNVNQELE